MTYVIFGSLEETWPLKTAETAERYGVKTLVSNIFWNIFKFTLKANGPMNIPCFKSVILISFFFPKSQSVKFTH